LPALQSLTPRELAAILAGLRMAQARAGDGWPEDGSSYRLIASDGGRFEPLTVAEIEVLCDRVNFGEI
jgi:hypothetical protein